MSRSPEPIVEAREVSKRCGARVAVWDVAYTSGLSSALLLWARRIARAGLIA
jgi:hypothetical protein